METIMTKVAAFPSTTTQLALPLLFPGQAQKEFFLNEALSILDAMVPRTVLASLDAPPVNPEPGTCYRILAPAKDAWTGHDNAFAIMIGGDWQYVQPVAGMAVYDRAAQSLLQYDGEWRLAPEPTAPKGGNVVDSEARQALADLVEALRIFGLFPRNGTI